MDYVSSLSSTGLIAAAALLLTLMVVRRRNRGGSDRRTRRDDLDTVADWQPEAARVLTADERQAHDLLRRALPPDFLILAQVPLSRYLRVPMRHSYSDWLQRVGRLSADLLVCDASSRVLLAIDIRGAQPDSERSRRRHDRLTRVLQAAGVRVQTWDEGRLPSVAEVRTLLAITLEGGAQSSTALIPVPEIAELLAEGDLLDRDMEPVASTFFDDFDTAPHAAAK